MAEARSSVSRMMASLACRVSAYRLFRICHIQECRPFSFPLHSATKLMSCARPSARHARSPSPWRRARLMFLPRSRFATMPSSLFLRSQPASTVSGLIVLLPVTSPSLQISPTFPFPLCVWSSSQRVPFLPISASALFSFSFLLFLSHLPPPFSLLPLAAPASAAGATPSTTSVMRSSGMVRVSIVGGRPFLGELGDIEVSIGREHERARDRLWPRHD